MSRKNRRLQEEQRKSTVVVETKEPKEEAKVEPIEPTEPTTPATETPTADTSSAPAPVDEAKLEELLNQLPDDIKALVNNFTAISDPELRQKAKASLDKCVAIETQAKDAEKWEGFNTTAEAKLKEVFAGLQKEFGVTLLGRKIVVSFAEVANPQYSHTIMGTRSSGNGGHREGGGLKSHGKVEADGVEHNSLHALCVAENWKYEGRRTAWEAVQKPQDLDGKDLPYTNKTEVVDGKIIVTRN